MGLGMPIPDLSNKPGPGRPGWSAGTYDFQFEVTGAVTIKAQPAATGTFTIKWPDGTEQTTAGSNSIPAPNATAGIVSINEKTDTTYADEFAIVGGQTNVSKVISWGKNPWSNMTNAFSGCTSLSDISTTSFISSTQGDMITMFNGCTSLLEADIKNWDLTAGADWYGGSPFKGLVNLQKLDATGLNVKLIGRADNSFAGIGTAVTDGCEFLMSGFNMSTSTAITTPYIFDGSRIKPTSDLSNWVFNPSGFDGTGMFRNIQLTGTNSTLNCSGWSTYPGARVPDFNGANNGAGDTGAKVNLTNLNVSSVTTMSTAFQGCNLSGIVGLSTWGATAGNVSMYRAFYVAYYFKFDNSDNFSSTFIESLTPTGTNFRQVFDRTGQLLASDYGDAPNITNIDLSGVSDISAAFTYSRFKNVPDFASATFNSSGVSFYQLFLGARFSDANSHFDFSNIAIKITNTTQMFRSAWIGKVTFGNNVDFSSLTTVSNMHYYMNGGNPNGTTTELTYPTNADFSSLTTTANWFAGTVGPTTGPLTTCQVDNLIRRFRATAYSNALFVDFYQSQITEAPSIVRAQQDELVANGWTFDDNTTDATLPFAYPSYIFDSKVAQSATPTTIPTGSQFSTATSGVTVDPSTGVVSWANTFLGIPVIRCTYTDGCYNEVEMLVVSTVDNNYSMEFSGTGEYFNAGTSLGNALGSSASNFSLSVWINITTSATNKGIFTLSNGATANNVGAFALRAVTDSRIQAYFDSNNVSIAYDIPSPGGWHHIVIVKEGASAKCFIDGNEASPAGSLPTIPSTINFSGKVGLIGTYWNSSFNFDGNIDELSVFNTALSSNEVKLIYLGNSTNKSLNLESLPTAPIAWYRMGD